MQKELSGKTVTYRDHSATEGPIALPDPGLLAVHRDALAKVFSALSVEKKFNLHMGEASGDRGSFPWSTDIGTLIGMNAARKLHTD